MLDEDDTMWMGVWEKGDCMGLLEDGWDASGWSSASPSEQVYEQAT
jgi:hypothetical protein